MGLIDTDLLITYGGRLLAGAWMTIRVVAVACALGFVLSYPLARARMARNRLLAGAALGYVTIFRGTPLLCQLYLVYYGAGELRSALSAIGLWWFFRDAFYCCVFTFTLNTAAYQAEILRGALAAVPAGQVQAAQALGLSKLRTARHVVWPQAMLFALPPLGNELIGMIKASALAAIVTLLDLMGQTRYVFARTFDFSVFLYAAILYLMMTAVVGRAWAAMQCRLSRHLQAPGRPVADAARVQGGPEMRQVAEAS